MNHASKYVKLTKDQAPMEDIEPGELNQPIDVPQVLFFCKLYVQDSIFFFFFILVVLIFGVCFGSG